MKRYLPLLAVFAGLTSAVSGATFTVTNTADTGAGSLRQALTDAAASAGQDTIEFNLQGAGPHTIQVASALPDLAGDILDGTAAAGGVNLEYSQPYGVHMLTVTGTGSEVKGANFRSVAAADGSFLPFYQTGLRLAGNGSHRVMACQFTGRQTGMLIDSPGNLVGGGTGARNRFASLLDIEIAGSNEQPASGNTVKGNEFVAPSVSVSLLDQQLIGIKLGEFAAGTVVESDTVTGAVNSFDGLRKVLDAFYSTGLVFRGNRLGDTAANADVPDSWAGCLYMNSCDGFVIENNSFRRTGAQCVSLHNHARGRIAGNVMRNTAADQFQYGSSRTGIGAWTMLRPEIDIAGNVIAGMSIGIRFQPMGEEDFSGTRIHGNTIGLTGAYTATSEEPVSLAPNSLAPVFAGISIEGGARNLKIGGEVNAATGHLGPNTILANYGIYATRNYLGTAFPAGVEFDRNRIAATAGDGTSGYHLVPGQAIVLNPTPGGSPEFHMVGYSAPPNDPLDADTGSNNLQNHPVITGIEMTAVDGALQSAADSSYRIQCYGARKTGDQLQGVPVFIGATTITTGADGNASFSVPMIPPSLDMHFWAVATDSAGNTSHFSDPVRIGLPSLSITPPAAGLVVQEGTSFSLTLTKEGNLSYPTTVNLGISPEGTDLEIPSPVTFLPGESSKQVEITVTDDSIFEGPEAFGIFLSDVEGGIPVGPQAEFTVASSDPLTVTVGSVTVVEGSSGSQTVNVPVHLNLPAPNPSNPPFAGTFPVNFRFSGGTATEIADYAWRPAYDRVLFTATQYTRNISIVINSDQAFEPDETIQIEVLESTRTWSDGSPMLASSGHTAGTVTITNDDPIRASIITANQQVTEGATATTAALTVQLDAPPLQEVRVQWQTVANTAEAGSDFTAESGELIFAPGETSQSIDIAIAGDGLVDRWPAEPESFHVDLTAATGAVIANGGGRSTISIQDDDARAITVTDATITEGNVGLSILAFTASIPAATGSPVSFSWSTADATAVSADYAPASGTVTIPPGETSTYFGVEIKGDTLFEIDESFTVSLTNPVNGPLTTTQVTGTILNNDAAPTLTIDDTVVTVGPDNVDFYAWFRVRTSAVSGAPVQSQWSTQADTATPGVDYAESTSTVTIPAGERTRWIAVPVYGDSESETDETFSLRLTDASGATIPGGGLSATATLKEVAISAFFPLPGVSSLYVIRFPTGKGQAYLVEQSESLGDEASWIGVFSIPGSGTTLTHTQYSDSPNAYFRVRVLSSPPPN